ncbi:hypothetical protein R1sor_025818 [Riccia sorocarpa]|uniref:Uncharacterized protein n=1 Tax=Riccia sorocarpa TaxID=122646 RepID=A0ABD3G9Q4_9MARC
MPKVIQYQDPEDVESQEESEHGQSHDESERESASRSSGEHEGVDEELDEVDDDDEDEDPESLDFADLDVHGALGRPTNEKDVKVDRDFSQLSVNRFRPVNGLLDKELRLFQEEFDLWDDLARSYNFPEKWLDGMLKFIPDKPDKETVVAETAVEDLSSSDEEEGSKKKKKPKRSRASSNRYRHRLLLLFTEYIVRSTEKSYRNVLSHLRFYIFTRISPSITLNDMKDARALLECGAYEGDRSKREVEFSYPCWQLVYAFVSLGPQDYKPVLVENPKLRPFSVEFEPKHADVEREVKEGDQPTNIKMKAPRWEFVGMEALNDRGVVLLPVLDV